MNQTHDVNRPEAQSRLNSNTHNVNRPEAQSHTNSDTHSATPDLRKDVPQASERTRPRLSWIQNFLDLVNTRKARHTPLVGSFRPRPPLFR